jgi:hypothetical protein
MFLPSEVSELSADTTYPYIYFTKVIFDPSSRLQLKLVVAVKV